MTDDDYRPEAVVAWMVMTFIVAGLMAITGGVLLWITF
jgi:hypothetical protein